MMLDNNILAFVELLRSGLWETDVNLSLIDKIDYDEILHIAEQQAVIGLIVAGIELLQEKRPPQDVALSFAGMALQIEQRNSNMNKYVGKLVNQLYKEGFSPVLVKGQGIAQCYERPLWRSPGDIDFLIKDSDYWKTKSFFDGITDTTPHETIKNVERRHLDYQIGPWIIELHGTLHGNLSRRIDKTLDAIQNDLFSESQIRVWNNGEVNINLPSPDNDVIFVFTHILQHFFNGGCGFRQLCDLSRLLWTYRETIDRELLFRRLSDMKIMTEWKAFGYLLVNTLGLPSEVMPFYDKAYHKKADKILSYIIEVGNFGQNKDINYQSMHPVIIRKIITFWRQAKDNFKLASIFPIDSPRFLFSYILTGSKKVLNGD